MPLIWMITGIALTAIGKAGLHIWRWMEPLGRHFLPAKTASRAFGLGLVWGWLPCGLVYSALTLSMASASPGQGALIMLGFGLGTLPMLFAMGSLAVRLMTFVRQPAMRQVVGLAIILFGAYTFVTAFGEHGTHHASVDTGAMEYDTGNAEPDSH